MLLSKSSITKQNPCQSKALITHHTMLSLKASQAIQNQTGISNICSSGAAVVHRNHSKLDWIRSEIDYQTGPFHPSAENHPQLSWLSPGHGDTFVFFLLLCILSGNITPLLPYLLSFKETTAHSFTFCTSTLAASRSIITQPQQLPSHYCSCNAAVL